MSDRPTPETDAVAYRLMTDAINHNQSIEAIVFEFEGFSRRLERERDEAREALRQIWQSGDAFLPYIDEETTNRWRKADGLILFLDEIQTAPEVLAKLRWFAEDMPELPVVAAGS